MAGTMNAGLPEACLMKELRSKQKGLWHSGLWQILACDSSALTGEVPGDDPGPGDCSVFQKVTLKETAWVFICSFLTTDKLFLSTPIRNPLVPFDS